MSDRNIAVKILGKTKEYPYGTPYAKIDPDSYRLS